MHKSHAKKETHHCVTVVTNSCFICMCCCGVGVRPRGFSVSSVSLASLNLADNDSNKTDNKKNNR